MIMINHYCLTLFDDTITTIITAPYLVRPSLLSIYCCCCMLFLLCHRGGSVQDGISLRSGGRWPARSAAQTSSSLVSAFPGHFPGHFPGCLCKFHTFECVKFTQETCVNILLRAKLCKKSQSKNLSKKIRKVDFFIFFIFPQPPGGCGKPEKNKKNRLFDFFRQIFLL